MPSLIGQLNLNATFTTAGFGQQIWNYAVQLNQGQYNQTTPTMANGLNTIALTGLTFGLLYIQFPQNNTGAKSISTSGGASAIALNPSGTSFLTIATSATDLYIESTGADSQATIIAWL